MLRWVNRLWLFVIASLCLVLLYGVVARFDRAAQQLEDGAAYLEAGQPDFAMRRYEIALEADPSNLNAQLQMAIALAELGQSDEARTILMELDDYPRQARVVLALGWLDYDAGDFPLALEQFDAAFDLIQEAPERYGPTDRADVQTAVGWGRYQTVGCRSARGNFARALELVPGHALAAAGAQTCAEDGNS